MINKGSYKIGMRLIVLSLLIAVCIPSVEALSASLEFTPSVSVRYTSRENMAAIDEDEYVIADSTYLDYLLGFTVNYSNSRHLISLRGNAGYEQFLTLNGDAVADDTEERDYDHMRVNATARYVYRLGEKFNLELSDTYTQSRDLWGIFGLGTDSLEYVYLYGNNIARINLKFRTTPKSRVLVGYSYHSLIFYDPNEDLPKPPDSLSHHVVLRGEYDFTGKTTGIADVQYNARDFEDNEEDIAADRTADYTFIRYMLGFRYRINDRAAIEALGGASHQDYSDISRTELRSPPWPADYLAYDIEDTVEPVGTIIFVYTRDPFKLNLEATQGVSTYGTNLFFTYTGIRGDFNYQITPKIRFGVDGSYQHAIFDIDKNGREWMWKDDREDDVMVGTANISWDVLQKGNVGTLTLIGGYSYRYRDSSIDDADDYADIYATVVSDYSLRSYDTEIQVYYVEIKATPSIGFNL